MRITGNTRVFLILGDPVAQVRAPEVFNHLFEQHGIDAVLVPAQVTPADFAAFARTALKARNIAGYGEFMILSNLSLKAKRGKITLLLGPNGAGKSTVLKTLFGMLKVRQGRIRLDGQDITGASAKDLLVQHGVAFVPQGRNLFGQLTAYENLELGGITLGMKTTRERIPELLERFPRIKERLNSAASSLSGGEQKQLEVGRALLLRPKVILIDEPSIGPSPMVVQDVFKLLRQLGNQGTTVLWSSRT